MSESINKKVKKEKVIVIKDVKLNNKQKEVYSKIIFCKK